MHQFDLIQYTWDDPLFISRGHIFKFPSTPLFLSLKIVFVVANCAQPDEIPHNAALHKGLHCLPRCIFRTRWYSYTKG